MPFTARDMRLALVRAGFVEVRQSGSHLRLQRTRADGSRQDVTIPMHRRELPVGTLRSILRSADMTEDDIRRLLGR